ncbi:mechanosensitive ion channel family protein, partial [Salmonella enterica]|nr:mechanosensitive ion channel family protein [Salmonella enterica]
MKCVYIFLAAGVSLLVRELVGSVIRMSKNGKSLGGVVQIVNYVIYVVVGVIILAVLTDKNPVKLVAGLGASAAIVSLVFKDSIQSLVAGVQLLANDMLSVGDWIVVPKANANGRVIAIHLNTVKIRNWDNTVTTVPPSTLLSDSFTSWQDMLEGKGRRISRSLCIDMASVRFLTKEEIEKYDKMPELYVFLQSSREPQEITNITNLTLFRHYMYQHLLNDSQIHLPYFGADEEMKEATEAASESG